MDNVTRGGNRLTFYKLEGEEAPGRVPKRFRGPQNRRWSRKLWERVRAGMIKASRLK